MDNLDLTRQLEHNPYFADEIFPLLPKTLQKACTVFSDKRVRDLYLLAQLASLSSCFTNAYGIYDDEPIRINFNAFIGAPAGSGKGKMKFASIAMKRIGEVFKEEMLKLDRKNGFEPELVIPGNGSLAGIISMLEANYENGLIFQTEADTLIKTFLNDWGDSSDLIRMALHNETYSILRKGDYQHTVIENPILSLVLSGTLDQYQNFIGSYANGLYSRFCYYTYYSRPGWKDPRPKLNGITDNLSSFFKDEIGLEFMEVYKFFLNRNTSVTFSNKDWDRHHDVYNYRTESTIDTPYNTQIVYRYGLVQFKIAMLLTLFRAYDFGITNNTLIVNDRDAYIAEIIVTTLYEHAINTSMLFLPSGQHIKPDHLKIFNALADKNAFSRKEFVATGENVTKYENRMLYNHFNKLVKEGVIIESEKDLYHVSQRSA